MLKALYEYAARERLILPAGYVRKNIRAYISLAKDGAYLGIMPGEAEKVPCPDIGSMANSGGKCNLLAEKRSILFPANAQQRQKYATKAAYFCGALADAAQEEPCLAFCLRAMQNPETAGAISAELDRMKLDGAKVLSFMVDGQSVLEMPGVRRWWGQFRRQFLPAGAQKVPCLIAGQPTVPLSTVPPVSGLSVVGGHARGDALICFDKDAFCSYGLKQAANAPVSEEAFAGVKAALDDLLADAPILAGMKFVHWYDKPLPKEDDDLMRMFGAGIPDEETDDEAEEISDSAYARQARLRADALVDSVTTGTAVHGLPDQYYILLLSGVKGRVMVRAWLQGNYRQLTENLTQWEADLALVNSAGTASLRPVKLTARLIHLLTRQKSDQNIFERMKKELAGLTPAIIQAILNATPFPDAVANRSLAFIRSQMFSSEDDDQPRKTPDPQACQWLKAWLCRRERQKYRKEVLTMEYNVNHPEPAYHCGALVAVYGAIQNAAMPDVNASLIDRYYASASQTPALVLGQLARMSNYHIGKLEKLRDYYADLRDETACAIGPDLPAVLLPEQQAYFALGYYQMCAKLEKDRRERIAAAKAKKAAVQTAAVQDTNV